jgi:hypothetical protein
VNPKASDYTIHIPAPAYQYLLTADELLTKEVKLNGTVLKLTDAGELPDISGRNIPAGEVQIPGHSILFLSFEGI